MPYKDPERRRENRRQYYQAHSEKWTMDYVNHRKERRAYQSKYVRERRDEAKAWLLRQKEGKVCVECGLDDPTQLEFHHLDRATKIESVSRILQRNPFPDGYKRALIEMKKCVLLCGSCHDDKSIGRHKEWGVKENARRYPLARCLYLARSARKGIWLR